MGVGGRVTVTVRVTGLNTLSLVMVKGMDSGTKLLGSNVGSGSFEL